MTDNPATPPANRFSPHLQAGVIAAIVVAALDQAVKLWLLYGYQIGTRGGFRVTPFFDVILAWNTGISYGWFQGAGGAGQIILLVIKALAVGAFAFWLARATNRLMALGLGLIIGGALGNAIDRILHGAVVDFALFHINIGGKEYNWYVFNLADVAIVAGVAALLYNSFKGDNAQKVP